MSLVSKSPSLINSLSEISEKYTLFVLDMWGVLYNGTGLYENVLDCLKALKEKDKKIILLSNAPRTNPYVVENLETSGLTGDLYDAILTSGDLTNQFLKSAERKMHFNGQKVYFIGAERHLVLFEGAGLDVVDNPQEADFVLMTGPREIGEHLTDFKAELEACSDYHLPMICANPDKYVMVEGQKQVCGGLLAQYYQNLGQKVQYFGKPYGMTYKAVQSFFPDVEREKIIVIGDALETDIKGGVQANLDSILIAGGIHLDDLGGDWGKVSSEEDITSLCQQYDLWPSYVLPNFRW